VYRHPLLLLRRRGNGRVRARLLRVLLRNVLERVQNTRYNIIPANLAAPLVHVCTIRLFTTLITSIRSCHFHFASYGHSSNIICHGCLERLSSLTRSAIPSTMNRLQVSSAITRTQCASRRPIVRRNASRIRRVKAHSLRTTPTPAWRSFT
jgi:hypothetical protein